MSHYYVYKIIFVSGHWYIGKRKSEVDPHLDVRYNGSGTLLKKYMKNHNDFHKEIVGVYNTELESLDAEKQILGDKWRTESYAQELGLCLNLVEGGGQFGGIGEDHVNFGRKASDAARLKMSDSRKGENNYWYGKGELLSGENNPFFGKTHSDETKAKISSVNKGKLAGENNPRYGVPCAHTGKFGSEHPMFGRTGESNSNFRKKQFCNLLGNIVMANPESQPDGYYLWTRWGFTDKTLRGSYPKELRGQWV